MKLKKLTLLAPVLASLALFSLQSCKEKSPSEKIGDGIEDAADEVGDAVEDATDGN